MKAVLPFAWRSIACGVFLAVLAPVAAEFGPPEPTPVTQLVKSAEDYLRLNPTSADACYTLARIHYLAFHLQGDRIPALHYREGHLGGMAPAPQWMLEDRPHAPGARALTDEEALAHAKKAIAGFKATLQMHLADSKNSEGLEGLVYLGIASLEEDFAAWNRPARVKDPPPGLAGLTAANIRAAYVKTLAVAWKHDSHYHTKPLEGISGITSYEAASAIVRLAQGAPSELTAQERKDVEHAQDVLKHFKSLKEGPVTPIVFSFQPVSHLDELLAPDTTVDFDLRGYGPRDRWPWIKPQLGLLVWDPERTGKIASARQLFGGYTFEIFRANGYDALAALDDNRDGVLSGSELDGICVWFNRHGDGLSTPDEVIPVRDLGIESIAVTMDGYDGIHPTNSHGITLRNGASLRTWDWIAEPHPRSTPALTPAPIPIPAVHKNQAKPVAAAE